MAREKRRVKLTKRFLDHVRSASPRGEWFFDTETRGFYVRAYPTHAPVFAVIYGDEKHRRHYTIGTYGNPWTLEEARAKANKVRLQAANGEDPIRTRAAARSVPTFKEWADSYLEGVKKRKKNPKPDERYLKDAKKAWGPVPLDKITAEDVQKRFRRKAEIGNTTANRWLASIRACFAAAWRMDKIPSNPASKVRLLPENPPRARVLTHAELAAVVQAVTKLKDSYAQAAFTLLLETGARSSEVLRAKWEDFELEAGLWRFPKPKAGKPQVVPLADSTIATLRNLKRKGPFVIPGARKGATGRKNPDGTDELVTLGRHDLKGPWEDVKEAARAILKENESDDSLEGVTLHDFRRTFGLEVARSAGLHVASKLLRHSAVTVTEKVYAPLGIEELRKATQRVAKQRGKVLKGSFGKSADGQ